MALLPQNSLNGANASTPVPQKSAPSLATAPVSVSPNKVAAQSMALRQAGMGTAQAMNKSATNPANQMNKGGMSKMAKGGEATLADASPTAIEKVLANNPAPKDAVDWAMKAGVLQNAAKPVPDKGGSPAPKDNMDQLLQEYGQGYGGTKPTGAAIKGQDATKQGVGYAKGGPIEPSKPVPSNVSSMSISQIMELLKTHPALAGQMPITGTKDASNTEKTQIKANVGGAMASANSQSGNNESGEGATRMATGGGLEGDTEADNIVSYGPDGTPIIQNADGTEQYGDVNQLLGRPESASTLGTGSTPADTSGAANAIGSQQPAGPASTVTGNQMAKGGEETAQGTPPGSLSHEVADDIDAKLSDGEFVFSADTVRYYGLKMLTQLQDNARQQLAQMQNEGGIRSPGDGKNPDQGQFVQDQKPNTNFYKPQEMGQGQPQQGFSEGGSVSDEGSDFLGDLSHTAALLSNTNDSPNATDFGDYNKDFAPNKSSEKIDMDKFFKDKNDKSKMATGGLLKRAKGGMCYYAGGPVSEESQYKKGGLAAPKRQENTQYGQDNLVSAPTNTFKAGGIVTSTATSLAPKKAESSIPMGISTKASSIAAPKPILTPKLPSMPVKTKMKVGGLLKKSAPMRDVNAVQPFVGS